MVKTLLEGNLKGAGAGCPYVPKDELAKRTQIWLKSEILLEFWEKKFVIFGRWGRQLRKSMRMSLSHIERKLE